MARDIWVFVEHVDGVIRKVSLELLCAACGFAQKTGGTVGAALVGGKINATFEEIKTYADRVYAVDDEKLGDYTSDGYAAALTALAREHAPAFCLRVQLLRRL